MPVGLEDRRMSEIYAAVSTAEFGKTAFTYDPADFVDNLWYQGSSANLMNYYLADNVIRLYDNSKAIAVKGNYIVPSISASTHQETMTRIQFTAKSTANVYYGICGGLVLGTPYLGCVASAVFYTGTNQLSVGVSETLDDDPTTYPSFMWSITDYAGQVDRLYLGSAVGNYDKAKYNTFEFRLFIIQGTYVKVRVEFFINNNLMTTTGFLSDTVNDNLRHFALDLRPFLQVSDGNNIYIRALGVASS